MFKVMSFQLQGYFISVVPAAEVSGIKAHIKLSSGQIHYLSDEMSKEEAEIHCNEMIKEYETPKISNET